MAVVAAPVAPYTTNAGVTVPLVANVIQPVALTANNPTFQAAVQFPSGGGSSKPYSYAIT